MVIDPAACTRISAAIRPARAATAVPINGVHLSNAHRRETFRHRSRVSAVATGGIA